MRNLTTKTEARKLLKGIKSNQWGHIDSDIKGSKSYYNLIVVTKSTDKALFISTPSNPECKDGFWIPKSVCKFEFKDGFSDKNLVEVSIQMPYSFTKNGKEAAKHNGISAANAIANFITKTGGDIYCNA